MQNDLIRFLLLHLFFWAVLAQLTAMLLLQPLGFGTPEDFSRILEEMGQGQHRDMAFAFKLLALVTNMIGLLFPILIFAALFRQGRVAEFLRLDRWPKAVPTGWGVAGFVAMLPFAHFLYALNRQLVGQVADDSARLGALLHIEGPGDLAFTLVVLGLAPAVFEEFVYRGAFQRLLSEHFPGSRAGIWIAAVLFAAAHFDPAGFLPRFLLGAAFGWLAYGTGSLWTGICLHALFNSAQVCAMYFYGDDQAAATSVWEGVHWWVVAPATALSIFCWARFYTSAKET